MKMNSKRSFSFLMSLVYGLMCTLILCHCQQNEIPLISTTEPPEEQLDPSLNIPELPPQLETKSIDLSFCDKVLETTHGSLCAIQPSKTESGIKDFANSSVTNPGPGFGYHVIGVPKDWNQIRGVWIHFGGSYGSPYLPQIDSAATDVYGSYSSEQWLDEILAKNFLVIQISYANQQSINGDICGSGKKGYTVDNCAGDVRQEILDGLNHSSVISVNSQNGVYHRLDKLIEYLQVQNWELPPYLKSGAVDWSQIHVSGHSQGSGHAYFLAKNWGVKSACFLGGPFDVADSVNQGKLLIADWYMTPVQKTAVQKMGAFVLTTDTSYTQFKASYGIIGLVQNEQWFEASGEYTNSKGEIIDGHAASVAAPELAPEREQACLNSTILN